MASPVLVQVHGWSTSAILIAVLNLLLGGGMTGALAIWLKTRPKMREINLKADEELREDRAADIKQMREEIAIARREAKEAIALSQANQMLVHTFSLAFSLVSTELERLHPDNTTLRQAKDMVSAASNTDALLMAGLANLAKAPGSRTAHL